jgi:hypothetical protein
LNRNQVQELIKAELEKQAPQNCFTCHHFKFNDTGNRSCAYPYSLVVEKGKCQMWDLAEDWQKRSVGNFTV